MLADVDGGLRLDVALERRAAGLEPRDRAWVHELTYGVTRLRGRLDHLLARKVRGGLERLDDEVLLVLRSGAYQALYMGSVPAYAAISQSVDQAREAAGKGASGLVNAVLRGVAADGDVLDHFPHESDDPLGFLSTWGSHPEWMVARWLERWPAAEVRSLVEANNTRPELTLVPLEHAPEEAVAAFSSAGIEGVPVGEGTPCVRVAPGTDPVAALAVLPSIVQDPGANLVVGYADVGAGTKVADVCAAPGGKALALSVTAGYTVAADRSEHRMRLVQDNVHRTGRPVGTVVADARRPPLRPMDAVLVDVPCTGTGTLRRHPDGRWRLTPESVNEMATLQAELLAAAAEIVAPRGLLVYSTCTLEPEENRGVVRDFLEARGEFEQETSEAVPARFRGEDGFLEVLPQTSGFDGAFAARLRRVA